MIELVDQAAEVQRVFVDRGWRFCLIGGLAVVRWGEPRLTRDVDFSLFAGFGGEETYARLLQMIDRATDFEYLPGTVLTTACPEDLVVLKAFANRRQDLVDVAGIAARQQTLDWEAIMSRLAPLVELKEEPEILAQLGRIRAEVPG